jgi:hypothetical protein
VLTLLKNNLLSTDSRSTQNIENVERLADIINVESDYSQEEDLMENDILIPAIFAEPKLIQKFMSGMGRIVVCSLICLLLGYSLIVLHLISSKGTIFQ